MVEVYWKDERRKQAIKKICEIIEKSGENEEDVVSQRRKQEG
jgi:hypothetical protein